MSPMLVRGIPRSMAPAAAPAWRRAPLALLALLAGVLLAPPARSEPKLVRTEIRVERTRPAKETFSTLRFLKENRDFIRARVDLLEEKPLSHRIAGTPLDPRSLVYPGLIAQALAARDSVAAAHDAYAGQHLLESITQLGRLEEQLALMERLLLAQQERLRALEVDFTGHQQTALMVLVSGYPGAAVVTEMAITLDDGKTRRIPLSPEQRESLKRGGILELFHGFAEPREQVLQVTLTGDPWPYGDSGFMTLHPIRDRLMFLRLDLSSVQPAQGGASVRASSWLYDPETHSVDG
jgi:hypothetical protein